MTQFVKGKNIFFYKFIYFLAETSFHTVSPSFDNIHNLTNQTLLFLQSPTCNLNSFLVNFFNQNTCSNSNKCLNGGKCIDTVNKTSYACQCPDNEYLYFGENCQNQRNFCTNVTCSMHGYCIQNQSLIQWKCFKDFKGNSCEHVATALIIVKGVQLSTTIFV